MIETPQIVTIEAQHYACLHVTAPREEIQRIMGPSIREVNGAVAAQGATPAGPWFTHHFKRPDTEFDFEVCVPVNAPIQSNGRIEPGIWPAMRVARTVHHGDYSGLGAAWGKFMTWIAEQALPEAEDLWERYLTGPESSGNPADWRTELNRPLL